MLAPAPACLPCQLPPLTVPVLVGVRVGVVATQLTCRLRLAKEPLVTACMFRGRFPALAAVFLCYT